MTTITDHGFILHQRPYRESSVWVELLCEQQGRVQLLARGGRKRALHPFQAYWFEWQGKDGGLAYLNQAEAVSMALPLQGNALACGFYANELMIKGGVIADGAGFFPDYLALLTALARGMPLEPLLRAFEWQWLEAIGQGLAFMAVDTGEPLETHKYYLFRSGEGFLSCESTEPGAFSGRDLLAIAAQAWDNRAICVAAKRLNRMAVHDALGGQPIHARNLFHRTDKA